MHKLFAVGDIHGCVDLLQKALSWIDSQSGGDPTHTVFIGDYIDRGPDSKAVLDILMSGPQRSVDWFTCIRGNHEQMYLDSGVSRFHHSQWLYNGGETTLKSFGGSIGHEYAAWMESLPFCYEDELRIFVHAGLEPGIPLAEQDPEAMIWIREPFLSSRRSFGKHVVHGHTPVGPTRLKRRTNIDAGSFRTGKICVAAFLDDSDPRPSAVKVLA